MTAQNRRGEWVPSIPEPFHGIRKRCMAPPDDDEGMIGCRRTFWTRKAYRARYALVHILGFDD